MFERSRARFARSATIAARSTAACSSGVSAWPITIRSGAFVSFVDFHRPGEYEPRIVPSTSAAACSGSGTGSDSSSSQTSVPPTRESAWAVAERPCEARRRRPPRASRPRGDDARRLELAVQVEEDYLTAFAAQLAALAEATEAAAELLVDDLGAVAAQWLRHGKRERIRAGPPRQRDLHLGHRRAMVTVQARSAA
jgi:hypothetical protein